MKTKSILIIMALFGVFAITSCMKEPMACLDSATKSGNVGQSISFDASCSMDAHHYEWTFGDGATGEGASVTHAYNTVGTYSATMTAMSKNRKKEDIKTITVTIN